MTRGRRSRLQVATVLLAALSVATVLGTSVTAAVVQSGGEEEGRGGSGTLVRHAPEPGTFDYSGWNEVTGTPGPSEDPASYRAPADWEAKTADDPVEYLSSEGNLLASGHATSYYWGNDCRQKGGRRVPGGWVTLADTLWASDSGQQDGDRLVAHAELQLRDWGRGYATNTQGETGVLTAHPGEVVELDDGTTAGRAWMEIDMSGFDGRCLPDTAEIMITSIDTEDGTKSLVQARYLLEEGAVSDEAWEGIAGSLTP